VIKRIRALVRKNNSEKESIGVNEIIRAVIDLTANELTNNRVTLDTELERDLPSVEDRVQLQQVLLKSHSQQQRGDERGGLASAGTGNQFARE
jgi:C4-dicarboxylate-specific signal transduction histidine kinase